MYSDFNGFPTLAPNLRDFGVGVARGGALQTVGFGYGNIPPDLRGSGSVDLQTYRSSSGRVASGNYAFCAGYDCVSSGSGSFAAGTSCNSGHNYAVALGISNSAIGVAAVSLGQSNVSSGGGSFTAGESNVASLNYSTATGYQSSASVYGQTAHSAGAFAARGDAQTSLYLARRSTTDATPTDLYPNGSTSATLLTLPNDSTWYFDVKLSARRTDADNESAAYHFEGCIDRNANAASTAIVGLVTKTILAEDTAAWDADVTADTTNGALKITVTGEAAKTIRWLAVIRTVEVTG